VAKVLKKAGEVRRETNNGRKTPMENTAVLVTGATGFLGSHLVRLVLERSEGKVIASDISSSTNNLEDVLDRITFVRSDVGNFTSVLRLVKTHKPLTIYHTGAMLAPACDDDPQAGIQANALGTFHILEAARLFGVRQVIFASSVSIFDAVNTRDKVIDDYSLARPEGVYNAAKLFSENLGLFYRRKYGFDYRGLRLPAIVGPGAKTHGFAEYFNKAIDESVKGNPYTIYVAPHTRMPILHVQDVARAFVDLVQAPREQIKTVNYLVLGPLPLQAPSAQELVDAIRVRIPAAKLDFKVDEAFQKAFEVVVGRPFDDKYARQEWGWKPRFGMADIVDDFIRKQKELAPVSKKAAAR
jgi:threonine 3-dehydrogenase